MILHTLNASPSSIAFRDCLAALAPGDCLLLLGDGVYAAISSAPDWEALVSIGADIYLLEDDARAAGVLGMETGAEHTDMDGFVELSERCTRQMAWY